MVEKRLDSYRRLYFANIVHCKMNKKNNYHGIYLKSQDFKAAYNIIKMGVKITKNNLEEKYKFV
jgi:hypothetical protein